MLIFLVLVPGRFAYVADGSTFTNVRPIVEEKIPIGDWEADTVVGARHHGILVMLVERAPRKTHRAPET